MGSELNPFPNAKVLVQRGELLYAAEVLKKLQPAGAQAHPNLETVVGDLTIADGVRIVLMPGHTPGLQAVLVDTGPLVNAIASDNVPYESSWRGPQPEDWIPTGISVSLEETATAAWRA